MSARTVETFGTVDQSGVLTVSVSTGLRPGPHRVKLVLEENGVRLPEDFSWLVLETGATTANFPPSREELYDDHAG